jgi:hypothetical protein
MRAMTKSSVIEQCSVLCMLAALGASFWRPDASWPLGLMLASVGAILVAQSRQRTAAAERTARRYWMGPAIVLIMAAQFVYFARPEDRLRMWLYAAILAIAAGALLVMRRPRS